MLSWIFKFSLSGVGIRHHHTFYAAEQEPNPGFNAQGRDRPTIPSVLLHFAKTEQSRRITIRSHAHACWFWKSCGLIRIEGEGPAGAHRLGYSAVFDRNVRAGCQRHGRPTTSGHDCGDCSLRNDLVSLSCGAKAEPKKGTKKQKQMELQIELHNTVADSGAPWEKIWLGCNSQCGEHLFWRGRKLKFFEQIALFDFCPNKAQAALSCFRRRVDA